MHEEKGASGSVSLSYKRRHGMQPREGSRRYLIDFPVIYERGRNAPLHFILLFLILPFSISASGAPERPKIGLVLGGGGARGFAHVGVIKWLEEQQIPIDYIAGTSTGGLVGALYSMGHSPNEIAQLSKHLDWRQLMAPLPPPPFRDLTFRRKEDWREFPVRFELGWEKGLSMPRGLNSGHFVGLLVDRLSLPYWDVRDFDNLPIPFRCAVTDMEAGRSVVLKSGSLAAALRATMAVPSVFTPVEIEGRLLADGGLLNNLPVTAAKEMGAEVIIAVDVGAPLLDRNELDSIVTMADQSIDIMVLNSIRENLRLADVIILPDLKGYQSLDFDEFDSICQGGYEAAQSKQLILKTFSMDDDSWGQHLEAREARKRSGVPEVESMQITGTNLERREHLAEKLGAYAGSIEPDPDEVERELTAIYGEGRDYGLGYGFEGLNEGTSLVLKVREKEYGPPFIRFGIAIDGSELSNIRFGVRGRMTLLDLARFGSELRIDGAIGNRSKLAAEYYVPLSTGFFLAPRVYFDQNIRYHYMYGFRSSEYRIRSTGAGFDFGYTFALGSDEIRLGYAFSELDTSVTAGDPMLPDLEGWSGQWSARWIHDGVDSPVIPRKGWKMQSWFKHFPSSPGAAAAFDQAGADLSVFAGVTENATLFAGGAGGTTFSQVAPLPQSFLLGGPLRLGSLAPGELWGSRFVYTNLGVMRQISETSSFLGGRSVLVAWYEGGGVWEPNGPLDFVNSASAGLLVDSLIGPLFFGGSYGDNGRGRVYFALGTLFR